MPNFKFVSGKQIVARVIRATGRKLPSVFHDDLLEWIAEGLALNELTNSLISESTSPCGEPGEVLVKNYCAPLPCGLVDLLAVEDDKGFRIPESSFVGLPKDFRFQYQDGRPSVFEVNPYAHATADGLPVNTPNKHSPPIFGQDLEMIDYTSSLRFYKIVGNYIQTSFEHGYIKLHYLAIPTDKEGYPLIPDNENLKQALEWHVMKRLIGAGYETGVFTYKMADELYERHAARARTEISYPSLDDMARNFNTNIRLIPPAGYADEFFIV